MILLIDNFDSFTFNIYQYFSEEGIEVEVIRNNQLSLGQIEALQPEAIIISPGPGLPEKAGICIELVKAFYKDIPILGICLGHQIIGEALGAELRKAKQIKHGKTSLITHNGLGIFSYLSQPLEVMRYHSYVIDKLTLPHELEIAATSLEDNEIMAIKHHSYPVYGVQFHPESIGTKTGKQIIRNFLEEIGREIHQNEKLS
ncbi:aminodeoxychorismate/anthranilate synthase component II [Virgibacillus indicus]|uniref:Aminodeoxychorismate/anthranilate synthase component II n=1 Tax=Virgibacillus indicus TaxID=2024554 RepID=A0A265NCF2_9BACI|nr:aminodeoxychorismate/anthranilate synthase component II [Virgibacillus indicus]OZU88956.1 aminodeoxychorismate/anthranilate synthase component II [Virgibacillus indicus]